MTNLGVAPPIHLSSEILGEIARIGLLRSPSEACGILLPTPKRDTLASQVVEVPNRHPSHHDSYQMDGHDVMLEIEDWYDQAEPEDIEKIVVWHTHPGGGVGPSRGDLKTRMSGVAYLVVTLNSDSSVTPCWF